LRAFDREKINSLQLKSTGMEFASEMVLRASQAKLRMAEVPTTLRPDGRDRAPHLRSFKDGWRHIHILLFSQERLMAVYIPTIAVGLTMCLGVWFRNILGGWWEGASVIIAAAEDANDKYSTTIELQNITFKDIDVVGIRASCGCLTDIEYPFKLKPFSPTKINFRDPPKGATVEFFINHASSRLIWVF
jgi:hypothetical protein